eukprot:6206711-Pleurochrysis_carterae.AAC.1
MSYGVLQCCSSALNVVGVRSPARQSVSIAPGSSRVQVCTLGTAPSSQLTNTFSSASPPAPAAPAEVRVMGWRAHALCVSYLSKQAPTCRSCKARTWRRSRAAGESATTGSP